MKLVIMLLFALSLSSCMEPSPEMVSRVKGGAPVLHSSPAVVPFEITGSHIIRVSSIWDERSVDAVLDTGGMTMLDKTIANELHLQMEDTPQRGVSLARVSDISLGDAHVTGLKASVMNYLGRFPSENSMAGMIGSDWLRHFQTTIDYQKKTLTFLPVKSLEALEGNDHLMKMDVILPYLPTVAMSIEGKEGFQGMIDTGLSTAFVAPLAMFNQFSVSARANAIQARGWFVKWPFPGDEPSRLVQVSSLTVGDIIVKDAIVLLADTPDFLQEDTILIGKYFLDNYLTTLEYEHRQVLLRDCDGPSQDLGYSVGLNFALKGNQVRVTGVWKGSPADDAGIEPGDVLLELDDRSAVSYGNHLTEILVNPDIHEMKMVFDSSGTKRTVVLAKRYLFDSTDSKM